MGRQCRSGHGLGEGCAEPGLGGTQLQGPRAVLGTMAEAPEEAPGLGGAEAGAHCLAGAVLLCPTAQRTSPAPSWTPRPRAER